MILWNLFVATLVLGGAKSAENQCAGSKRVVVGYGTIESPGYPTLPRTSETCIWQFGRPDGVNYIIYLNVMNISLTRADGQKAGLLIIPDNTVESSSCYIYYNNATCLPSILELYGSCKNTFYNDTNFSVTFQSYGGNKTVGSKAQGFRMEYNYSDCTRVIEDPTTTTTTTVASSTRQQSTSSSTRSQSTSSSTRLQSTSSSTTVFSTVATVPPTTTSSRQPTTTPKRLTTILTTTLETTEQPSNAPEVTALQGSTDVSTTHGKTGSQRTAQHEITQSQYITEDDSEKNPLSNPAVIGAAVAGGVVVAIAIAALIFCLCKRRTAATKSNKDDVFQAPKFDESAFYSAISDPELHEVAAQQDLLQGNQDRNLYATVDKKTPDHENETEKTEAETVDNVLYNMDS